MTSVTFQAQQQNAKCVNHCICLLQMNFIVAHAHKLISAKNVIQDNGTAVDHALQDICSRLKEIVDAILASLIVLSVILGIKNAEYVKLVNFLLKMDRNVVSALRRYLCVVFAKIHPIKIHVVICVKMACSHQMANNAEHARFVTVYSAIH